MKYSYTKIVRNVAAYLTTFQTVKPPGIKSTPLAVTPLCVGWAHTAPCLGVAGVAGDVTSVTNWQRRQKKHKEAVDVQDR